MKQTVNCKDCKHYIEHHFHNATVPMCSRRNEVLEEEVEKRVDCYIYINENENVTIVDKKESIAISIEKIAKACNETAKALLELSNSIKGKESRRI